MIKYTILFILLKAAGIITLSPWFFLLTLLADFRIPLMYTYAVEKKEAPLY